MTAEVDDAPVRNGGTLMGLPPRELARIARETVEQVTKVQRPVDSLVGSELMGRYSVDAIVGRGGMATVFRGRHLTIGKAVAIKVLDPALRVPDAVERFLQEAQATSTVRHENVVEVTDFGATEDGIVFSVMELLSGEPLETTLHTEGALAPERAATIIRQICSGLQAAHNEGIVHRDLKPENCFRLPRTSNSDFIKVLDFGIAKVTRDSTDVITAAPRRTQVGIVVGTPEYMAPEQARGQPCDHRADVYSAGVILFQLLSGELPFNKPNAAEILAQHMYEDVPSLAERRAGLPPALCAVAERAMAKDPDERFFSMDEMSAAIAEAMLPNAAPAQRTHGRGAMWVVIAAVVLLGVAGWWFRSSPRSATGVSASGVEQMADVSAADEGAEGQAVQRTKPAASPARVAEDVLDEPAATEKLDVPVVEAAAEAPPEAAEPIVAEPAEPPKSRRKNAKARSGKSRRPSGDPPTSPGSASAGGEPQPPADSPKIDASKISEVKNPFSD